MVAKKRSYQLFVFVLVFLFFSSGFIALPPSNTVNRKVAVIYLKHTAPFCFTIEGLAPACEPKFPPDLVDMVKPPRHTASEYTAKFNASVKDYFYRVSFDQVNLSFHTISNPDSADGWFEAPHKLWHYNQEATSGASIHQDGVDLAYSTIGDSLADYDILLVIHNIQFYPMGYSIVFADGLPAQMQYVNVTTSGKTFTIGLATAAEGTTNEELFMVIGHELGHVHSLRHVEMGDYDLMAKCDQFNHFGGWSKLWAGWEPGITEMPCVQGPCEITTTLTPLEHKGNNILRIPYVENPFVGYFVECRSKVNHDENIPKEGVLITHIDTITSPHLAASLMLPHGDGNVDNAALSPGEYFLDVPRELMIKYEADEGTNGCRVKVVRGLVTAPDPSIRNGEEVLTSASNIQHVSRDIWMDSPKNGYDVYPAGYMVLTGGKWIPVGAGDPFWVGHENRIRFAVTNSGYGVAENIQVNVYVDQSVVIKTPGIACLPQRWIGGQTLVGTVTIDRLEMGEYYFGYVPWTPELNTLAKVTVAIDDYPDELTEVNNTAYENYLPAFSISNSSQFLEASEKKEFLASDITLTETISVQADENCPTPSSFILKKFEVKPIAKKDWVIELLPEQAIIDPGMQSEVRLLSTPPDTAKPGDCREVGFNVIALMDDIYVPVDSVGFKHCVVELSQLNCSTPSEPLEMGSSVQVKGELTPLVKRASIALEFTSPDGETYLQNALIEKDGTYQSEYLPELSGEWKVQAFWQGNDRSAPAESEPCYFSMASPEPQFIPNSNINCRSGPGTDYEIITFGGNKDVMEVEARSPDALWLYGRLKNFTCWISYELGKLNVDRWNLPVRQPPEKPAQTTIACESLTTEALCLRHSDVCKWLPAALVPGQCVNK